jgi:NTP pyrophosphatase (non-canonical NTP hydrolase)
MSVRNRRQRKVFNWVAAAFGPDQAASVEQRGLRLVEEAIEAAQAVGCDKRTLHKLIEYIYGRRAGDLRQELGGVGVCVLAMCEAARLDADTVEVEEIERVLSRPLEHFAARNREKNEAGFVSGAWRQPR